MNSDIRVERMFSLPTNSVSLLDWLRVESAEYQEQWANTFPQLGLDWVLSDWGELAPGPGELSNSRLASRYQLVNLNNRGKFGKWKDIALCVTDMFTIVTRMKYSLGLEPTKDVLGFWSDNSSNRTHWKAQIRREIKPWRPRQSSLIGSGNSCTTEPVGWVFWAGAYSRWPDRGAGGSSGPSSHPPEVKKFKSLIFIILDHNQMTFIT